MEVGEGGISILQGKKKKGREDWITGYSWNTEEQALGRGIRQFWTMSLGSLEHWTSLTVLRAHHLKKRNAVQATATPHLPCLGEGIRSLIQEDSERERHSLHHSTCIHHHAEHQVCGGKREAVVKTRYTSNAFPKSTSPVFNNYTPRVQLTGAQ